MNQDSLDFNTGDVIAFVLTVFSTILALVSMIEIPSDNHSSDEIYRLRALDTIMNSSNNNNNNKLQPNQLLWAYNKLHDPDHVSYYYYKNHYNNKNIGKSTSTDYLTKIDADLAMAIAKYNEGNSSQAGSIIDSAYKAINNTNYNPQPVKNNASNMPPKPTSTGSDYKDLNNETWFTARILQLGNQSFNKDKEDATCAVHNSITHTTVCSIENLQSISKRIENLTQKGFISNFYNTDEGIHAIEKPVETYVSYLNHFIIISLISGPITSIVVAKHYIKRKGGESNE